MKKKELSIIQRIKLDELILDLYGADLQKIQGKKHTFFSENGYVIYAINQERYDFDKNNIEKLKPISITNLVAEKNFHKRNMTKDTLKKRNLSHKHYGKPDSKACNLLKSYLSTLAPEIENELGTPFRIINVRVSSANKGHSEGPTSSHIDLGPKFMRKIMIYPQPMNIKNGTFEFYSRKGKRLVMNTNKPQAILFDSSILRHRGIAPKSYLSRPMIEITIIPNDKTTLDIVFGGQNARDFKLDDTFLPENLLKYKKEIAKRIQKKDFGKNVFSDKEWLRNYDQNKDKNRSLLYNLLHNQWRIRFKIFSNRVLIQLFAREIINWRNAAKNLNIGGGFKFIFNSWVNLDECNEKYINSIVDFSKVEAIPIPSSTIKKVYSSHFLEHVPDEGVNKILGEIHRVIAKKGSLVIKIPDYEKILEAYQRNNIRFLNKTLGPFTDTWANKNVKINSLNTASFIFAGYWNQLWESIPEKWKE